MKPNFIVYMKSGEVIKAHEIIWDHRQQLFMLDEKLAAECNDIEHIAFLWPKQ